jgi:hypothetical protein
MVRQARNEIVFHYQNARSLLVPDATAATAGCEFTATPISATAFNTGNGG